MSSQIPKNSLYPQIDESNPEAITSSFSPSSSSTYQSVDVKDLAENLFPENESQQNPNSQTLESAEEVLVRVPGTIVHLIDKQQSIELASGELTVVRLRQGDNVVVVDESHYFFNLRVPAEARSEDENNNGEDFDAENLLNYGVTIASKGQEGVLEALDGVLKYYSAFSEERVSEVVDGSDVPRQTSPEEMETEEKKMVVEGGAAAYWTTLAPNVEDYSGGPARMIAAGSGQLIKGILWCGDVTADRLRWGNKFLKKRLGSGSNTEISPQAMKRMKRVKKLTKMSDKVATGILLGVVKVSGFFTSSIVNSTVGKKFFSLLPGEIVLASLDGFNKVCDAVEVAGRNVMSTTSVVTTGLVSQRYGEQARKVTHEGLGAAGHAIGTAWAVFKIRKALNPKSVIKPTKLVKAAAQANSAELKTKNRK
ncbi:senescence/dehydration-associated protein-like protein [Actinidia rufa]|uniref:Senescence/dehydration-associated protein-like protein n=1 Tax=Actinidia rufa TaxID=165716 RepID=A0A7J0F8R8_9ERIC|nr:senescence/dehydration-associated protein-like protein [Actinidia rufa]